MKKIFVFFALFLCLIFFGSVVRAEEPSVAPPSLIDDINKQNEAFAGTSAGGGAGLSAADPRLIVGQIIKILLSITGTIFFGWTIFGGYLIFTSAGDSEKIEHAKSIIINGVIGIIIVLSSYAITVFIYRMWTKAQEDPNAPQVYIYVEPDTSLYGDPLEKDTSIPIK